jgi:hypothetical protein
VWLVTNESEGIGKEAVVAWFTLLSQYALEVLTKAIWSSVSIAGLQTEIRCRYLSITVAFGGRIILKHIFQKWWGVQMWTRYSWLKNDLILAFYKHGDEYSVSEIRGSHRCVDKHDCPRILLRVGWQIITYVQGECNASTFRLKQSKRSSYRSGFLDNNNRTVGSCFTSWFGVTSSTFGVFKYGGISRSA